MKNKSIENMFFKNKYILSTNQRITMKKKLESALNTLKIDT